MVFDEKVLTALEVLTDAAENDFELFRICNLVRDLVAPPKVEQIDEKHQRFNGVTYKRASDKHYNKYLSIHRIVWAYYNGDIPAGCLIHHDNENKADNDISNLQLKTEEEHQKIHNYKGRPSRQPLKTFVCKVCGKTFQAHNVGRNCFCSPECQKARSHQHYYTKICSICGKEFKTTHPKQKCCSRKCSDPLKRRRETRTCPVCGKSFTVVPHDPKVYCSVECYHKHQATGTHETRICAYCGKEFTTTKRHKTKCCSLSCAAKYFWQRKAAQSTNSTHLIEPRDSSSDNSNNS